MILGDDAGFSPYLLGFPVGVTADSKAKPGKAWIIRSEDGVWLTRARIA